MIEIRNLTKNYGATPALKGVSLAIPAGQIFGLLGPNGAGKTTLISILAGYLTPTTGECLFHGKSLTEQPQEVKYLIGLAPQEISLYSALTAEENLTFFGRMYGLSGTRLHQRATDLLEFAGLSDRKGEIVGNYSGGMKRRLNLVCALMHSPEYLFLDEPTVGVDPQSRERLFQNILKLRDAGTSILYTTHYIEEAEKLCDLIAIMDEGKVLVTGTKADLMARFQSPNLEALFLKLTGKELRD
ncbi:MAG: hypothetical protein A3K18_06485 [Lentisphaerae bacterium RIFOXYA12_64_32]|nr:MAG: hypothetical protein A3K18_06485 [Lentisphaerae bacterium RIFOXYA12_64_32]